MAGPTSDSVNLCADRAGDGERRVYEIAYTVTDATGGTCSGTAAVSVPHDQASTGAAVDSGQTVNSFGS